VFVGPGLTRIAADEILTAIEVSLPTAGAGAGYLNLGVRKAQDCNIVNVASFLQLDADESIKTARIVLGSVGPTHLRAPTAEAVLAGSKPGQTLFDKAGKAASGDCTPILDFRGSAEYRRAMVAVLTKRTLTLALKEARGQS
jgi:carbon-monoxide dehydrogenase medium subunit